MHVMDILRSLTPGAPVSLWFSNSNFYDTNFQFFDGKQAVFSGGDLNGLNYIDAEKIVAIRVH